MFSGAVVPLFIFSSASNQLAVCTGFNLQRIFSWFPLFPPSGTDKEETGWTDKRTRGFVQLCGDQQAHLHGKGETEGRAAVTLEVKAGIHRGGVYKRSFPFGDAQMLNRLTKSAEAQARLDEEYFKINMEGHQMRLKLENTLKNCHQVGKGASLHHTATQILSSYQKALLLTQQAQRQSNHNPLHFNARLTDARTICTSTCFTLGFPDHPGAGEAAGGSAVQQSEEIQPPDVQLRSNAEPCENVWKLVLVAGIRWKPRRTLMHSNPAYSRAIGR